MSFKEFRELRILLYADNIVSDEEFLLLYDTFSSKNPDFPHGNYERFDLDSMNSAGKKNPDFPHGNYERFDLDSMNSAGKKNPDFPHGNYERFDLDSMNSAECKAEFRVEKQDLPRLVAALQLLPVFKCKQRSICDDIEGLCLLLKRVAYPSTQ